MFHTIHGATVVCARPQPTQPSWPPPKREQHDEVDEVLAISDEDNVSIAKGSSMMLAVTGMSMIGNISF